ncbi:TIGR04222 domain-containing membrane protein [Actinokineospora sp. HUAS TT18]|uniref:TIGR04222 domain-containing membrane protein n=1 Tax=Actinokineospora sp. HUAS TT18 TaxID=3447451 RepID=UPI003F51EDE1
MSEDLWGLSGGRFLVVYWVVIVVVVDVNVWGVFYARRVRRGVSSSLGRRLDPYEIALLRGGFQRVVDTAVAGLIARGAVRVDRSGVGRPTGGAVPADPYEAYALGRIGSSHRLTAPSAAGFAATSVGGSLVGGLVAVGLYTDPRRVARARRGPWLFALVVAAGVVRLVAALGLGRPVALLVMSLVLSLVVWLVVAICVFAMTAPRATGRGRAAVQQARAGAISVETDGSPALWAAVAVALGGLVAFPDADIADAFAQSTPSTSSSAESQSDSDGCAASAGCAAGCSSGVSSCGGGGTGCGG